MQIIVIGCGTVGTELIRRLVALGEDVIALDKNPDHLERLGNLDCVKVLGTAIDREHLKRAGAETADIVCCVTPNENLNIMCAQICKYIFQVPKIIVRSYYPHNVSTFQEDNIDLVCTTKMLVNSIIERLEKVGQTREGLVVRGQNVAFEIIDVEEAWLGKNILELGPSCAYRILGVLRHDKLVMDYEQLVNLRLEKKDEILVAQKI